LKRKGNNKMVSYNDISTSSYRSVYETLMTVRGEDAYLIRETREPLGSCDPAVEPHIEVFIREDTGWIECDPELTDWIWKLYNDFSAVDIPI
tara:strand:+ start:212 stop:487 length:276 start_codon:yes stop_codon:yes gene_type:complete